MLRPSKHAHPDRTVVNVAMLLLKRLKAKRLADYSSLLAYARKSVSGGDVLFLPSLWLFGFYVSDSFAGLLGLAWTAARALYAAEYYADAKKRGPGAMISMLIAFALLLGGTIGALLKTA